MRILIVGISILLLFSGCGGSSNDSSPSTVVSSGSVSGFVTASDGGGILQDASVQIDGQSSNTSGDGAYTINDIGVGQKSIAASKSGYQNHTGTVSVVDGMTTSYDIVLNPEPAGIPSDGLVAYFPLDGNSNDSSGNNNHGVEFGGVSYVDSNFGQALSLDGTSGYVRVNNPDQLFTTEFTLAVWMATEFHWGQVVSKYNYNGLADGFGLFVTDETGSGGINPDGSRLFASVYENAAVDAFAHPSFTLVPDQMSKVSFVYKNGVSDLYVDGELKETKTIGDTSLQNQYDILIGTYFDRNNVTIDTFSKGYKGLIDELRIYNRALTQDELQRLP